MVRLHQNGDADGGINWKNVVLKHTTAAPPLKAYEEAAAEEE